MKFTKTGLDGAYVIEIEPHCDDRGFFARAWCHREFETMGIRIQFRAVQHCIQQEKRHAARYALSKSAACGS